MGWTEQERTLDYLRQKYGPTAFCETHVHYRRVGYGTGKDRVSAIGDTWQQALASLESKVKA